MVDYGTDVAGYTDVDPQGKLTSGRRLLAEALARRYSTPRGRLIDDPNYGDDLTGYVFADMGVGDLAALQSAAEQEAVKDERMVSASVAATLGLDGALSVTVTVTDAAGPFKMVLAVSSLSVTLLTVGT